MSTDTNFFVTFPTSGTQTVTAGTTRVDFIRGRAVIANGDIISLANRSTQINPLQSLFFYIDVNINIELSLENETIYKGLIPAGSTTITDTKYDLLIITTSANTEIFIAGSLTGDIVAD